MSTYPYDRVDMKNFKVNEIKLKNSLLFDVYSLSDLFHILKLTNLLLV